MNLAISSLLAAALFGHPNHDSPPGAAKASDSRTFPYQVHQEVLQNGLKVLVVPMPAEGLVAYWTIVRTGARDEYEPGHTGFAHFFEHMMFKGTEKVSAEAYSRFLTQIGADSNAFTSDDLTGYRLGITSGDLEKTMEVESDRFMNLAYAKEVFKTEAGAVYGEYRKNRASPYFTLSEALHKVAYTRHTYGHSAMGFEADIKRMPQMYDYSRRFFSRYYRPENCVLLVVGDVEPGKVFALAKQYYGVWKKGYVKPKIASEPVQTKERRIDVPYEGRSLPLVTLAYKMDAFAAENRDVAAAMLLAELAFGETSEIHRKLVLEEQAVQSLGADAGLSRDPGLFEITTMVKDPAQVDRIIGDIDAVVGRFQDTLVEAQKLAALKSRLRYSFLMDLESPSRVASALAPFIAVTGGFEAVDALYVTFASITAEDVRAAARKYLDKDRRTVAVLRGKA